MVRINGLSKAEEYKINRQKSDEFIYHVFALALRNGYGKFEKIVLISDGASWIKTIKIIL